MSKITSAQIATVQKFLDLQGLTFKPLREELMDHLLEDLNLQISQGKSFPEAWASITDQIPEHHFTTIQSETMEAIQKKISRSRVFSVLSLFLLALSSIFKVLHLPGAAILLVASMVSIAISFVISSISGIRMYRNKKGGTILLLTVAGILLFFLSWMLQILNMPGGIPLRFVGVFLLLILFPALTIYFYNHLKSEHNILVYLHQKHTEGINRFLTLLLSFGIVMEFLTMIFNWSPGIAKILLLIVALTGGFQFFALNWHPNNLSKSTRKWVLVALIVSFPLFIIPTLGSVILIQLRIGMIVGYYMIAGILAAINLNNSRWRPIAWGLYGLIAILFLCWGLTFIGILPEQFSMYIFNIPVLMILIAGLILFRKNSIIGTFMIIVLAHYLYEFPI